MNTNYLISQALKVLVWMYGKMMKICVVQSLFKLSMSVCMHVVMSIQYLHVTSKSKSLYA